MMLELLFLLLPVAAFSGWYAGRRTSKITPSGSRAGIPSDYLKGMNYLLNEQPDKAIDTFIQMLDVDSNTIETHLALGSLFRRRGEVDRAIRIHQNLIARPTLLKHERSQALFELGQDYMRAGLLDRAETLLTELTDNYLHSKAALGLLLDIYQQEKDWDNAIRTARKLEMKTGESLANSIAQFYCELAELAKLQGEPLRALKLLKKSLNEDRNCVRASILEAQVELTAGDARSALRAAQRIEQQDSDFLPEVLPILRDSYTQLGRKDEYKHYLFKMLPQPGGISIVLELAEILRNTENEEEAEKFITEFLRQKPSVRGIDRLIDLNLAHVNDDVRNKLQVLKEVTSNILKKKPVYQCNYCGFNGKTMHWQCPGCKCWNTIKPIQGLEGE